MKKIKASQAVKEFLKAIAKEGGNERAKSLTKFQRLQISMMGVAARRKKKGK